MSGLEAAFGFGDLGGGEFFKEGIALLGGGFAALSRRQSEPFIRFQFILFDAGAVKVAAREKLLRIGIPGFGGVPKPRDGLFGSMRRVSEIAAGQDGLRAHQKLGGGMADR